MFSAFTKYISDQDSFQAQRHWHEIDQYGSSTAFLPSIAHYDIEIPLSVFNENGSNPLVTSVVFPSEKYDVLDFTPAWEHHRFIGWYKTATTPSQTANTSGTKITPTDSIKFDIRDIHGRWQLPATVVFDATTNGGQMPVGWISPDYYIGQQYGILPVPRNDNGVFTGWYTSAGILVSETSLVANGTLIARYDIVEFATTLEVEVTDDDILNGYTQAGIYSANRIDSTKPVIVDWGDGGFNSIAGNISYLTHTYTSAGTYRIRISDNISSLAMSNTNGGGDYVYNSYILTKILDLSPNITSIPDYGFQYCRRIRYIYAGSSGELTLGRSAFERCAYECEQPATYDFSGRTISSFSQYCFRYCSYLKTLYWPSNMLSIGNYAFAYCFQYPEIATSVAIPEGVTDIGNSVFRRSPYLTAITLPSTLSAIGTYTFASCTALSSITSNIHNATGVAKKTTIFGNSLTSTSGKYTGLDTAAYGTNRLYVPAGAIGYDTSPWSDVLLDPDKCGFTKEEI